jgi:catechol 2,3-dioxygenase-like lactoylglutathione lyase family enzyme
MFTVLSAFSGISVSDLEAARHFYTETLGLKLIDDAMGLNFELPGGGRLFIYAKPDHQPASFTVLNFVVADIDEAVQELTQLGAQFERYDLGGDASQDATGILRGLSAGMGPDIAWFHDPAGNILSVLQDKPGS